MTVVVRSTDFPDISRAFTAEELFAISGDRRFELIQGMLKEKQMPTGDQHGAKTAWLSAHISLYVYTHHLGDCFAAETGFLLSRDPDTVLAPDFAFVSREKLTFPRGGGYVRAIPDLVLETRSPNDRPRDVTEKVQQWLNAGAQMVLELNPERGVLTVFRSGHDPILCHRNDTFDGAEVLSGFALPLTDLLTP